MNVYFLLVFKNNNNKGAEGISLYQKHCEYPVPCQGAARPLTLQQLALRDVSFQQAGTCFAAGTLVVILCCQVVGDRSPSSPAALCHVAAAKKVKGSRVGRGGEEEERKEM